ncbi:hypothetical protein V3C99_006151 [Haemonchus contortus]
MHFFAVSAFLLLYVQSTLAWSFDESRLCEDYLDEGFCRMVRNKGDCHKGSTVEWASRNCWKTCGNCDPPPPKDNRPPCKNTVDGNICLSIYEKGDCDKAKDICALTCHFCW